MKALVLYDSIGGNTEKVANKINETLILYGFACDKIKLDNDTDVEFYDYELIFLGSPVIEWLPSKRMMAFIKDKLMEHRLRGDIIPSAPIKPGKYAVCFGTFCGAHIGVEEALPMTQWLAAFLGHIGYKVLEQINVPAEMRNFGQGKEWMDEAKLEKLNTLGRFGNIKGKPDDTDLKEIEVKTKAIISSLAFVNDASTGTEKL